MSLTILEWRERQTTRKMKNEAPPSCVNNCMKRVREEEAIKLFERKIRDRYECVEKTFSNEFIFKLKRFNITSQFYFSTPLIRQLSIVTPELREKICELTSCIKPDQGRFEETEELSGMIERNPNLGDELQHDFIRHLIKLLEHEQNPKFQSHVAIILQLVISYSRSGKVVIDNIKDSIIVNPIRSEVHEVRVQGLWLLHTIAITYSIFPEGALELLISFLTDESTVHEVLCVGGRTLAVACQINPKLPCDKLKAVLGALVKLIEYEYSDIYPSGCAGLAYLCEGREEMIEKENFEHFIERLLSFNAQGTKKTCRVKKQRRMALQRIHLPQVQGFSTFLGAFVELIEYEYSDIYPSGCAGLAYLCEGREEMIEKENFEHFIERLLSFNAHNFFYSKEFARVAALGSIVRWGSDDVIDQVIKKGLRYIKRMLNFEGLLDDKGKYRLKNGCWIISNITARKGSRIKDAIDSELIDLLVNVVENYKSLDVKKEAAWAISNVIYGAGPDQIEDLRKRCIKPFWNLLKECQGSQEIVSLCLEGLVKLEGIKITCNEQPIDSVEWFKVFKKFLVRPQTTQFQIAEEIDELRKIKKIRLIDTIENSEGNMVLHLTCTFEVDSHIA